MRLSGERAGGAGSGLIEPSYPLSISRGGSGGSSASPSAFGSRAPGLAPEPGKPEAFSEHLMERPHRYFDREINGVHASLPYRSWSVRLRPIASAATSMAAVLDGASERP